MTSPSRSVAAIEPCGKDDCSPKLAPMPPVSQGPESGRGVGAEIAFVFLLHGQAAL
jgi:hypothetical protein